jgi:hypothetical protein
MQEKQYKFSTGRRGEIVAIIESPVDLDLFVLVELSMGGGRVSMRLPELDIEYWILNDETVRWRPFEVHTANLSPENPEGYRWSAVILRWGWRRYLISAGQLFKLPSRFQTAVVSKPSSSSIGRVHIAIARHAFAGD